MKENDKKINSIIDEYKMSMGGCFFNNNFNEDNKLENNKIDNILKNNIIDINGLLTLYDEQDDYDKRDLFKRVSLAFINLISDKK